MLNPLNSGEMDDYVQRLNAQLRKMPPQERAEVNQELRQHLEAQAQAHEELGATPAEAMQAALRSFGDPSKIGRQMYQEWRQSQPSRLPALGALLLGPAALILAGSIISPFAFNNALGYCLWYVVMPALSGAACGLCLPRRAVHNAFWGMAIWLPFTLLVSLVSLLPNPASVFQSWVFGLATVPGVESGAAMVKMTLAQMDIRYFVMDAAFWLPLACLSAYLISAHRRGGWYRLRLADLKLRLR